MNYLQLFVKFIRVASLPGDTPTTVSNQTGDRLLALDFLNNAYMDVQQHQTNWRFMRTTFEFNTISGKRNYTISEIGLTDHERWLITQGGDVKIYLTSSGVASEQYLDYLLWDDYKRAYLFGTHRTTQGYPRIITIQPDNSLDLHQVPNNIYTLSGEYYKAAQELSANEDIPVIPTQFHMIIIWRALMFYAAYTAANEKYTHGQNEYKKILRRLQFDQLPAISFGAPLV